MQSMIRVHTFIRYCGLQLKEAEVALQEERHDICFHRIADAGDSLLKSLAAALPTVRQDFFSMDEKAIARHTADLAPNPSVATEAASLISSIRKLRQDMPAVHEPDTKLKAEKAYSDADRAYQIIQEFFDMG